MVKNIEENKKNIICCELVGNLLRTHYGYDFDGIEDFKNDYPKDKDFLPSFRDLIKWFVEDKENYVSTNRYDWLIYAALHGQFEKLCTNCQGAYKKIEHLSKKAWESPENQKIIAYSLSNKELLQEVQRRVRNKKISLAYNERSFEGLIAKDDDYFCEFDCCANVYDKEFSINAWKPSWEQSKKVVFFRDNVQWEATVRDWKDSYSLPIEPSKSNQELFKWLEKIRKNLLKAWSENKKEDKDYELLEEVTKRMKSKGFSKYDQELQKCFIKVKEQLKKQTKEWEKKWNDN